MDDFELLLIAIIDMAMILGVFYVAVR